MHYHGVFIGLTTTLEVRPGKSRGLDCVFERGPLGMEERTASRPASKRTATGGLP
jgi:hypothetical protein